MYTYAFNICYVGRVGSVRFCTIMSGKERRHSYTDKFKLAAIQHAEENGNHAAARKFDVTPKHCGDPPIYFLFVFCAFQIILKLLFFFSFFGPPKSGGGVLY